MTKQQFETALQRLTPRRREVLEHFLAGERDQAIAQSLFITENTVRQHIRNILKAFNLKNDLDGDHSSQRSNLIALFAQYQPELLQKPVTEAENQRSESVSLSNDSNNKQDACTTEVTSNKQSVITPNKQDACTTEYDRNFVGRENAIADLNNLINKGAKIIQIIAPGGVGKSTLANKYLEKRFKTVLEFNIAKERETISSVESWVEENLRDLGEEPGREFMISLKRLKQKLQTQEIAILIDNLEPALDGTGRFIEQHRSYVELLGILSDPSVKSLTLITSREPLNEPSVNLETYKLLGLTLEAWQEYFKYQEIIINSNNNDLREMRDAFGGNAKAMDIISKAIKKDSNFELEKYWTENKENLLIEPTLQNLIKEQFKRLKQLNLNDAYNLLCRLGCYRYQDVPTIPEAGLFCLLWDVAKNQHKRIIKVLKERALVEFNNGDYWLHPVIREEAINRLRISEDWEKANTQAAEFWTESVTQVKDTQDIFNAFESFHHYIVINYYNEAAKTILYERTNAKTNNLAEWEQGEPLGRTFYKYGLSSYLINYGEPILENITDQLIQAKLYNLIGSCFWSIGDIKKAISIYQKSLELIAQQTSKSKSTKSSEINVIKLGCLKQIGICLLELYEIEEALKYIKDVVGMSKEYAPIYQKMMKPAVHLIIPYEKIDSSRHSIQNKLIANIIERQYPQTKLTTGFKEYGLLFAARAFFNVGNYQKSTDLYNQLIQISQEHNLKPIMAKALTGLAELYRIQNDFETALTHHQQSIRILDKLGAKCDLAEAYFQLALTYQGMGDVANSQEYFNKAIYLWSPEQIDAPKQIERVLKAMNCED